MLSFTVLVWIFFFLFIFAVVALDLGVFHRKAHVVSLPEAVGWTCVWVTLALAFNVVIYYLYEMNPAGWDMDSEQISGGEAALNFFTGYLVEKSLSIDNIFVIAMIFVHFQVPIEQQHRVLFWGILGAVVIGQEHVTTPLSNALESGKIHHAYLFSGPRGCGKTSSARIMAMSLNCEKGPTPADSTASIS